MNEEFLEFTRERDVIPAADPRKAVLIVEDDEIVVEAVWNYIQPEAPMLWATNNEEGLRTFEKNRDRIAVIVFDHTLSATEDTLPLIRSVAPRFNGPMIASSTSKRSREAQLAAGCTHAVEKHEIARLLLELLNPDH